jgi:hypothetical protein
MPNLPNARVRRLPRLRTWPAAIRTLVDGTVAICLPKKELRRFRHDVKGKVVTYADEQNTQRLRLRVSLLQEGCPDTRLTPAVLVEQKAIQWLKCRMLDSCPKAIG